MERRIHVDDEFYVVDISDETEEWLVRCCEADDCFDLRSCRTKQEAIDCARKLRTMYIDLVTVTIAKVVSEVRRK